MKKPKNEKKKSKSVLDRMRELGQKYGVEVRDGSESGIHGIGFLGGVRQHGQATEKRSLSTETTKGGHTHTGEE